MSIRSKLTAVTRFLFSVAVGLAANVMLVDPIRAETWSDATGKFQIDAEYVGVSGQNVVLRKPDGKTLNIPINKLSAESRAQAKKLYEKVKSSGGAPAANVTAAAPGTVPSLSAYKPKSRDLNFTPPIPPTIPPMLPFPENASLQATLDHVRNQAMSGHLEVFWYAFPDDLRASLDSSALREGIRPHVKDDDKMSEQVVDLIDKLTEVLVTKKQFILHSPTLAQVPPQFLPMIEQGYDPAAGLIYEFAQFSVATQSLLDTKLTDFVNYHLPRIGAHLTSLVKLVPVEMVNPLVNGLVVKQTSDTTGTLTFPKKEGGTETTDMVRYHNRWLPKQLAEQWEAEKDTIIQKLIEKAASRELTSMNAPANKEMIDSVATQMGPVLDSLIAAKTQQEFDQVVGQLMLPMMMMMGAAGGPGGPVGGPPAGFGGPAASGL